MKKYKEQGVQCSSCEFIVLIEGWCTKIFLTQVMKRNSFKLWYLIDLGGCLSCFPAADNRRAKHLTDFGKNDGLPTHNKKYFISHGELRIDLESLLVTALCRKLGVSLSFLGFSS